VYLGVHEPYTIEILEKQTPKLEDSGDSSVKKQKHVANRPSNT